MPNDMDFALPTVEAKRVVHKDVQTVPSRVVCVSGMEEGNDARYKIVHAQQYQRENAFRTAVVNDARLKIAREVQVMKQIDYFLLCMFR